jgi:hypothetical protein
MDLKPEINWREIIYRGIESEELDYKAAQNWSKLSASGKAKFVRHCLAMANTKGGYVVVGVGEDNTGKPALYTGISDEYARSFDPTSVGNYINKYADPQINFVVERPEVDGKQFVIFVIKRFDDLPHVCTQSCEHELLQGVFYIRTKDASSRPAFRSTEIHQIIRRALRNQRELLGKMIRGILYEEKTFAQHLESAPYFREQLYHSRDFFKARRRDDNNSLYFDFQIMPAVFIENRFTLSELKRAAENSLFPNASGAFISLSDFDEFYSTNTALRCLPEGKLKLCQLFQSGLFHYISFIGNEKKISYSQFFSLIAEAFFFISRFYDELALDDDSLTISLQIGNAENAVLTQAPAEQKDRLTDYMCRIPKVKYKMVRSVPNLISGYADHAARTFIGICERFNMPDGRHPELAEKIISYTDS